MLPISTLFTTTNETGQDKKICLNDRKLTDASLKKKKKKKGKQLSPFQSKIDGSSNITFSDDKCRSFISWWSSDVESSSPSIFQSIIDTEK